MKILSTVAATAVLGCTACSTGVYLGSTPRPASTQASTTIPAPSFAPVAVSASVTLSSAQIATIRAHYSGSAESNERGNGRGRSGGLPPGIARNLERGKPLPPGIAKQYLPQNIVSTLPPVENGLEYIVAAGKLLLVEAATEIVRDVLIEALFD